MALLGNYNLLHKLPLKYSGGTSGASCSIAENRSNFNMSHRVRNTFVSFNAWDTHCSISHGTTPPYCWVMARQSGGISSRIFISGGGLVLNTVLSQKGVMASAVTGTGSASTTLSGKGSLAATAYGTGYVSATTLIGSVGIFSTINGNASVTTSIQALAQIVSSISAVGTISASALSQILALIASISGTAAVSFAITGKASLGGTLSGQGSISGSPIKLIYMLSNIYGTGTFNSSIAALAHIVSQIVAQSSMSLSVASKGYMSAHVTPFTDLSPDGLAQKLWNSLANTYTQEGTMGKKLNDAGGGSSPADIADEIINRGVLTEDSFLVLK